MAAVEVVEMVEEENENSVDLDLDRAKVGIVIPRPLCLVMDDRCLDFKSYLQ